MSLNVTELTFAYRGFPVLKGVDFSLEMGALTCILGKNGAGKSTLFRCLLGMLPQYGGDIILHGKSVRDYGIQELSDQIAYIPQMHGSVYNFSVSDMVLMGTTSSMGLFSNPKKVQEERAQEAMELLGIEYLKTRTFAHLSGGEQQMVLIARAIAQQAKTLVMDEPCANLDYGNQIKILEIAKDLAAKGYLILMSTHSPEHALLYADEVLVLNEGRVLCKGEPTAVMTEEVLKQIYGIEVSLIDTGWNDKRVCVPFKH